MNRLPTPPAVLLAACKVTGAKSEQIVAKVGSTGKLSRTNLLALTRAIYCGVAREVIPQHSYPELARAMHSNSHSVAIAADLRWRQRQDDDEIAPGLTKRRARSEMMRLLVARFVMESNKGVSV